MTLEDYRVKLGWSKARLSLESGVDVRTIRKAIEGKPIFKAKAGMIANALSRALGSEITYRDFEGLNLAD